MTAHNPIRLCVRLLWPQKAIALRIKFRIRIFRWKLKSDRKYGQVFPGVVLAANPNKVDCSISVIVDVGSDRYLPSTHLNFVRYFAIRGGKLVQVNVVNTVPIKLKN
uniref:Uncharacterized protein n=1 Tax=Pseudoalteromonas rubra TaxID=43658 RepID=A0A0F4QWV3_9GAMM|nr:hypothetical protein TW77_03830 [Pseudoalteromonas rubra]